MSSFWQLSRLMGGDVRLAPAGFTIEGQSSLAEAVESVKADGGKVSTANFLLRTSLWVSSV